MPKNVLVKRVIFSLLAGLVLGVVIAEMSFILLRETARAPKDVTLVIPQGTADQVARGDQPPTIPENMIFVVGDTLIVQNEDTADHKLGPLFIPAKSSARLALNTEENLAYECSFQPSKYFGLDVQQAVTLGTRLYGILEVGVPLGILFALYTAILPVKKNEHAPA